MSRVKAEAIKKDQEFKPAGARGRVVYEFRVQNAMNVKMVAIKPDGKPVVVIGGENGAGKSNTIRSLFMTLHSRLIPSDPILHGQEKLGTYVDFGDIQAQLCVTSKGDYLKVTAPDLGNSTPKEYISRLVGKQTGCEPFDAQAFAELCKTPEGRRQQVKTLLKLYGDGYDLDAAQKRKDALYQERALVNKDIERLEGKLALTKAGEVPGEEIPLDELMQKLQTATAEAATLGEGERGLASLRNREAMAVQEAKRLRENIARLKAELVKVEHELERCQMEGTKLVEQIKKTEAWLEEHPPVDLDGVRKDISAAEEHNRTIRAKIDANREYAALRDAIAEKKVASGNISAVMATIEDEKTAALSRMEFPIQGLGFGEGGVTFNGVPLEQASESDQLRIGIAIALSLIPENGIRLVYLRDWAALDQKRREMVHKYLEENGGQAWAQLVQDRPDGNSLFISDGILFDDGEKGGEK